MIGHTLMSTLVQSGWRLILTQTGPAFVGYAGAVTLFNLPTPDLADELRFAIDMDWTVLKAVWNWDLKGFLSALFSPFTTSPHSLGFGRACLAYIVAGAGALMLADLLALTIALVHIDWRTPLRGILGKVRRQKDGYERPLPDPDRARQQMGEDR